MYEVENVVDTQNSHLENLGKLTSLFSHDIQSICLFALHKPDFFFFAQLDERKKISHTTSNRVLKKKPKRKMLGIRFMSHADFYLGALFRTIPAE